MLIEACSSALNLAGAEEYCNMDGSVQGVAGFRKNAFILQMQRPDCFEFLPERYWR